MYHFDLSTRRFRGAAVYLKMMTKQAGYPDGVGISLC